MRNFIWSLLLFVSGIFISFSQTNGIEKGTYLANNKGQSIKLNLLDNNKYELVFYTGEYEIKGDSLLFIKKEKPESNFDLAFATNKKSKKIKIQFLDLTYDSFYLGTQKGSESIVYQRLSDLKNKIDPNWEKADLEFEIEKTDYLYLVYENYDGKSNVCKYALPKDVSEVTIKFDSKALADLKICGFFDRKTNELKISDRYGENPLVFLNEKEPQPVKPKKVIPLEDQIITNWTYPGKDPDYNSYGGAELDSIYNGSPVDTTAVAVADYPIDSTGSYSRYDFKLKIEDNLKKAIESTKTASNKFLVVVADSKNKTAKEGFDTFIKDQETQVGYNMYDKYDGQYDLYNYYLAGAEDKKWLKSNKITYDQSIFILNGNGDLLAVAKSDLTAQTVSV
ncbi:hypothetical protein ACQ9BO_05290 [Flavobacterium sp. P21]|uniref:hypothetical protein n=1 Tax=Flavobacterium sp. P21 TaxID=3423948 RepID=UPI003D667153